jgi:hypothetical protein
LGVNPLAHSRAFATPPGHLSTIGLAAGLYPSIVQVTIGLAAIQHSRRVDEGRGRFQTSRAITEDTPGECRACRNCKRGVARGYTLVSLSAYVLGTFWLWARQVSLAA